jgi:nucleotide-binding universal stress UspA family protein
MKKILIAFDGSPGAEAALQDLVHGGFPEQCEAKVLAIADVWLPPDPEVAPPPSSERIAAERVQARQNALETLAAARQASIRGAERVKVLFPLWTVHHSSHADSPAWGILAEARRWGADLINIGSHGRSPLQKFFLGSVSHKVAAEAPCSVRVFREHHRLPDHRLRVVIAQDGSDDSSAAFEEVLRRDWPKGTEFQLITVIDARLKAAAIMDAGIVPLEDSPGAAEDWVPAMLAPRVQELQARGFTVLSRVLEGDPKPALLHAAHEWNADCIFIGARGMQHGSRLYLGTVSSAIVTRAHCTVEIVRPALPS